MPPASQRGWSTGAWDTERPCMCGTPGTHGVRPVSSLHQGPEHPPPAPGWQCVCPEGPWGYPISHRAGAASQI